MPETRADRQRRLQHLHCPPPPEMSTNAITYAVSESFRDQSNPGPIRRSTSLQECLKDIRHCLGETIETNARLTVAPTAMATGGYGQEAAYTIDPQQRSTAGHTIAGIARAAEEIEERNWSTDDGRDENQRRIYDTINRHERASAIIQANAMGDILPRPGEAAQCYDPSNITTTLTLQTLHGR